MRNPMYELYKYLPKSKDLPNVKSKEFYGYKFGIFEPSIFRMLLKSSDFNQYLKNIYWLILTRSNYKIYYAYNNDLIIHTSYCTFKSFKFPFINKEDVMIGPCNTNIKYGGQGIYPYVLSLIVSDYHKKKGNLYMIINENNILSKKGAAKVGFKRINRLHKNNFFKTYKIID